MPPDPPDPYQAWLTNPLIGVSEHSFNRQESRGEAENVRSKIELSSAKPAVDIGKIIPVLDPLPLPMKYLPTGDEWDRAVKHYDLKDNGITRAIHDFWSRREDEFDKRLAELPTILKLATDMKKSAAGVGAAMYLAHLIAVLPAVRKNLEDQKADFAKNGMHPIDVQIMIVDWNGRPMSSAFVALTSFAYPGAPKLNLTSQITSTGVDLHAVRLKPTGTLYLKVSEPGSPAPYCEGETDYDFKPGKTVMKFKAKQKSRTGKVRARTVQETSKTLGVEGEVGLEFKVLKVDGKESSESEYKRGFEHEVEWEVEVGEKGFEDFKQL
jgi:hypothetical protein